MNYIIIFIINFFFSSALYSADIRIIDLHSVLNEKVEINENNISQTIILSEELVVDNNEEKLKELENLYNKKLITQEEYNNQLNKILGLEETTTTKNNEEKLNEEKLNDNSNESGELELGLEEEDLNNKTTESGELESNLEEDLNNNIEVVKSLPDFWQNSDKEDLEFLFNNLKINNSKVLTNLLLDTLVGYVNAPKVYSQEEFDNLRVKTLINLGQREKALSLINNINTYDSYKYYYDLLKLKYYFSINDLTEACNFKETLQDNLNDGTNIILKINIFCSFIQDKIEEADFLNSLLLDTNENDEYFQNIYFNLKNNLNELIDISALTYNDDSMDMYSSMLRIGNFPINEKFLEYDPINFSLPIILSSSTDIFLRLKSAHTAYELGLLSAESLSALYQSVDFTYKQLNNSIETLGNFENKPEMGMALLFQKANVQLLTITRLESLKEFWNYAKINNMEVLAYDISKNLIEVINPSEELSEYSLFISRAHIHNKNFISAEKWILFAEKYIDDKVSLDFQELRSIKLLYELKTSESYDNFINILIANLYNKESKLYEINNSDSLNDEILTTILSVIIEDTNLSISLKENKQLLDKRIMPSRFIIEKMISSSRSSEIGELILSANISMNGKFWHEINSYHLKTLLESFSRIQLYDVFKDLIIEILEESKII